MSNPRPPAYKAGALTDAELRPHWDWEGLRIRPVALGGFNEDYFALKGVVRREESWSGSGMAVPSGPADRRVHCWEFTINDVANWGHHLGNDR